MRMNKHLLRISICLWLCLFTFISTWGEDVPFNHKGASEKWTSKTIAPITVESNGTGQTDYIKIEKGSDSSGQYIKVTACPQGFD